MNIFDKLSAMETGYQQAEAAAGSKIPDGKHRAIGKEARLLDATETKPITLSTSWIIMDGDHKGRMLYINQRVVQDPTAYAYLKRFLQDIHLPAEKLTDLPGAVLQFPGTMITASVVTSKNDSRYQNTYVDEYLGRGDVAPYLKKDAAAATQRPAQQGGFVEIGDDDADLPFN